MKPIVLYLDVCCLSRLGDDQSNPDALRRRDVEELLSFASYTIVPARADADRAIEALGFTALDALHLSCAERAEAIVFLTTDDDLLRLARRSRERLQIRVENPIKWYGEVQR